MFNLEKDPEEMNNIYYKTKHKGLIKILKNKLRALIKELDDPVNAPNLMENKI